MKDSKTVEEAIKTLYAVLASAAAKKAVRKVEFDEPQNAEKWAGHASTWLRKAGAQATRYYYERPRA